MQSEFEFIKNIKQRYALERLGDDCSVLPNGPDTDLLVTVDMLVEEVDFRLGWTSPDLLGHKALAVSLSDIAAMGGKPNWAMLSIAVPENLWKVDFLELFYKGWFALAGTFGVELVGGDVSRSPDKLVIDSIVGGEVARGRAIMRSGATPGDSIFVSGTLGGAAGGLRLLQNGLSEPPYHDTGNSGLLFRQRKPHPQIELAMLLQGLNIATSMIDISDGLSSDLAHICDDSGVGAMIDSARLPIDPDLAVHFPIDECVEMALNGGEDFELLFTASEKSISHLRSGDFTRIGRITANVGIIELDREGKTGILEPKGYRHF